LGRGLRALSDPRFAILRRHLGPHKLHMRASQPATEGITIRFLSEVLRVSKPSGLPSEATTLGGCVAAGLQADVSALLEPYDANLLRMLFSERSDPNSPFKLKTDSDSCPSHRQPRYTSWLAPPKTKSLYAGGFGV